MTSDTTLRDDMMLLRSKRIYFGHQSVGVDILNGVKDLIAEAGGVGPVMISVGDSLPLQGPFLADSPIGRNSDPNGKCDAFARMVERTFSDSPDIALMKFCYADVNNELKPDAVFSYYAKTIAGLKRDHPHTTFVHVTIPYTVPTPLWKVFAKKLLGKDDPTRMSNLNRNRYNTLLLQRFAGEPVFDLARIESTFDNGQPNTLEYKGEQVFTLIPEYTYDGGHLNERGRLKAARELIHTLADVIRGLPQGAQQ